MRKDRRINTENLVNENDKGSKLTFLFDVNQKPKVKTESLHEPVSANFNSKTIKAEKSAKITQESIKNDIKREKLSKKSSFSVKKFFKVLIVLIFLPIILLVLIVRAIVKKHKQKKWEREGKRGKLLLLSADISQIDIMEGYEFEEYLKTLFFFLGYNVESTSKAKDYGADLIITDGKERTVVQAKRYNKTVGIRSVQEVLGAKKHYGADQSIVVSNSTFTFEAETLAKENAVRLIDRAELIELYKEVKEKLKLSTKESELVAKENRDITDKFPHMI